MTRSLDAKLSENATHMNHIPPTLLPLLCPWELQLLLLLRIIFLHNQIHNMRKSLHFFLYRLPESVGIDATSNIDGLSHTSGKDLGHSRRVLDARWCCVECCRDGCIW